jgi:hypothetical protein
MSETESSKDLRGAVHACLRAVETADHFVEKWGASFQGQSPEAVAEILLPHVASFYGVVLKKQSTGRVVMSGADKTLRDRAAAKLSRMVRAIVGETSAHAAAVEAAEEGAAEEGAAEEGAAEEGATEEVKDETPEATPEQVAAMAQLIQTYGMDRNLANKALSKAFALMKAAA